MTAAQLEQRDATMKEVVTWRFEQLLQAGYDRPEARRLSRRIDIDLHQAIDLRLNGCPPALALSILL